MATSTSSTTSCRIGLAAALVAALGVWMLLAPPSGVPLRVGLRPGGSSRASAEPPATLTDAPNPGLSAPALPTPDWLQAVPPAIALYSPGALTLGGGDVASFADAFGEAMGPWQAGNHAEAALRLDALAGQYPDVAEAHFYRGVAWLLAGVPEEAVAPLRRAVAIAPSPLQADASWYLGLALMQTQRLPEAVRVFGAACTDGDARACRTADHLDTSGHPR